MCIPVAHELDSTNQGHQALFRPHQQRLPPVWVKTNENNYY